MLKLHFAPNSRAGRIVWLLEELELPYDINKMSFHPKDLKSDEHRARHPLGRVPVLEDGDVSIFESGAIVDYILERHKNGGLKPAVDDPRFPAYLQWFHYCEGMVMPPMNTVVVHTLLLPEDRRDATVLGQAQRLLTKALEPVNEALAGKDYLIGDFSGADIMLGHACFMANRLGSVSDSMTSLKAYVARIAARPAFHRAITMSWGPVRLCALRASPSVGRGNNGETSPMSILSEDQFDGIKTLGDVARVHARVRPDAVALKFEGRTTTYAMLDARTNRVAHALQAAGVSKDERVGYLAKNTDYFIEILIGAAKLGAVTLPIGWRLAAAEIGYLLHNGE